MEKTTRRKAPSTTTPAAPEAVQPPPDMKALEARYLALMASLVNVGKDLAKNQAMVNDTPVGQTILHLQKELAAIPLALRQVMEPLKVLEDKPIQTTYGKVGFQKATSWVLAPEAVRAYAPPEVAVKLISESVDNKKVEAAITMGDLTREALHAIQQHPLSEEKHTYSFICKPLANP